MMRSNKDIKFPFPQHISLRYAAGKTLRVMILDPWPQDSFHLAPGERSLRCITVTAVTMRPLDSLP